MTRLLVLALLVVALAFAPGASGQVPSFSFPLPADGTIVHLPLEPGAYLITVGGTYDYDDENDGDQLADAECSTDSRFWEDPVDRAGEVLPGTLVSDWHRHRYVVGVPEPGGPPRPFYSPPDPFHPRTTLHFVDVLDVGIGATPERGSEFEKTSPLTLVEWEPVLPTAVNGAGQVGAGCDESSHIYATEIVVPVGVATVDFQIVDTNYTDNAGSLDVRITGAGG